MRKKQRSRILACSKPSGHGPPSPRAPLRLIGRQPKSARRTAVVSEIRHTLGTQTRGAFQRVDRSANGSKTVTEAAGSLKTSLLRVSEMRSDTDDRLGLEGGNRWLMHEPRS